MMTLRTPRKTDFFQSRIEPKPKPPLSQLTQAIENLSQEINECDQQISRWRWKRQKIASQYKGIAEKVKSV